jgi:hypothetical protein
MSMAAIPSAVMESNGESRDVRRRPPREVQELWFATRRHEWKSLAIVSTVPQSSVFQLAVALAQVAELIHGPVRLRRAEQIDLAEVALLVLEMSGRAPSSGRASGGPRVPRGGVPTVDDAEDRLLIVAVESVVAAPLMLPIVLAADAVLLSVELGGTDLDDANHSIELIGRDHLIGSVIVDRR